MNLILKPNFIRLARTHVNLRHEFLPIKPGLFVNIKLPELMPAGCSEREALEGYNQNLLPYAITYYPLYQMPPLHRKYRHRF